MTQVFVSYARQDEAMARRVAKALQSAGYDVWWDNQLPAHRAYSEVIERNLKEARAAVVLWSQSSAQSQWVRAEADLARSEGKLIQANLDGTMPPLPFNQIQCADLKGWRGSTQHPGWAKLQHSVAALVSGEEMPHLSADIAPTWWRQRRYQLAAALGILLLAVALLLVPQWLDGGDGKRPVVAVLPFESLDNRDASLVAGIWEDTRHALARNPQLLVLGPNTSEELAEKGGGAVRKAADYVVNASVRSIGDRIRISTDLIRTEDNAQVWSERFDRKIDDVFVLQDEIAREIEGRIRGRLARRGGVMPEHIATSGEVYALYSDARAKVRKRQYGSFEKAAKQLEQVVRMDPNFAPGWATLSIVKKMGVRTDLANNEQSAEANARRAIALAPNLATGHAALGFALGDGPAAQASLRRALALDPNDIEALNWLANSLDRSQSEERLRLYSRIVEIEPYWWPAILNMVDILFDGNNVAAAEQVIARLEKAGNDVAAAVIRMNIMAKNGDQSGVVSLGLSKFRTASESERELLGFSVFTALHQLGYSDEADKLFPPPSSYIPFIRANDSRALDMIEEQHSAESYWTSGPLPIIAARVYLLNGQGPRLAKRYRAVASSPEQFEETVGKEAMPDVAPGVALALRSAGDDDQARRLLDLAERRAEEFKTSPGDQEVRLARIHAVQGKTDQAIGELSTAIRGGWIPPFLPINTDIAMDPPLAELKKDPRFEQLRQQILGHLRKERAELGPVNLN